MIISYVITAFALLVLVISALLGLKRGTAKSIFKAGSAIVAAIFALLLAKPIALLFSGLSDKILDLIESKVENFADITSASPTLVALITKLPVALFTPILVGILYFIFKGIINLILKLSCKSLIKIDPCNANPLDANATEDEVKSRKSKITGSKLIGMAIGIVPGAIAIFVILFPLAGYLNLASDTIEAISSVDATEASITSNVQTLNYDSAINNVDDSFNDSSINNDDDNYNDSTTNNVEDIYNDYIKPVDDNIFIKVVYAVGGKTSFNAMTSFKIDGDKVVISDEIAICTSAVSDIKVLADKPIKEYTDEQTQAINDLTDKFSDSVILPKITAELLSAAAEKWSNDESFMSMEKPALDETIDPLFSKMLDIFKTETDDTIKGDLDTLSSVFTILIDNDVLSSTENQEDLMDILAKEGLISSLLTTLCENDRMAILANEVTNMGVRAIATALKIPENSIAVQKEVVDQIKAQAISAITSDLPTEQKITTLSTQLNTIFTNNGMDVSADITPIIAETIISTFEGQTDITSEEINDYFVMLSAVYDEKAGGDTAVNQNVMSNFEYLSVTSDARVILCANNMTLSYDEFVTLYNKNANKFTCDRYKLKEGQTLEDLYNQISKDLELILGAVEQIVEKGETVDPSALLSMASPESLKTSTTTIENLINNSDIAVINQGNASEEGSKLEAAMSKASAVISSVNAMNAAKAEGKSTIESLQDFNFNALGEMLDILDSTAAFGGTTGTLAESALDQVTGQSSGLAGAMADSGTNFTTLFGTVGDTVGAIQNASDSTLSDEEKFVKIQELMNNLTPGSASIISKIITADLLVNQGVPAQYSEKTAEMIQTLFNEMAKVEAAEKEKEANAVKYLFDVGMSAKADSSTPLFGETGKIKDTNDFVTRCLDSVVVTNTLETTAINSDGTIIIDPIGIKEKVSDANQATLIDALNKYISDNGIVAGATEEVKDIAALAAIFNIVTTIDSTQIVFTAQ